MIDSGGRVAAAGRGSGTAAAGRSSRVAAAGRGGGAAGNADIRHSDTVRTNSYGVDAPFMQLQRHGWDIHAVSAGGKQGPLGWRARITSHGSMTGAQEHQEAGRG